MADHVFEPGQLRRIVVLGSGPVGLDLARAALLRGIRLDVYLGERQAADTATDGSLVVAQYRELEIPVHVTNDLKTHAGGPYDSAGADAMVFSFGSPYLIKRDLIDAYGGRVFNSHGAPLPEWRGGGGFSWRMLAGDRRGNTCFHVVTPGIDKGDIVFQRAYRFPEEARFPIDWMTLADREAGQAAADFVEHLYEGKPIERLAQDESQATYFPRLHTPTQAYIDWSWTAAAIESFVLAFSYPYPGARTLVGDREIVLMDCRAVAGPEFDHPFFDGLVYRIFDGKAFIAVSRGSIVVPLDAVRSDADLKVGDRLHTPRALLDKGLATRPIYTPAGLRS